MKLGYFYLLHNILFLYIYGNQSINKNKEFLKTVDQKFNIKVISPNFFLSLPKETLFISELFKRSSTFK